jgi:hypothetical protein
VREVEPMLSDITVPQGACYSGRREDGRCVLYGPQAGEMVPIAPVNYSGVAYTSWGDQCDGSRGTAIAWLAHYLTKIVQFTPRNEEGERRQWMWARQHAYAFTRQLIEHLPLQWDLQVVAVEEFCVLASMEVLDEKVDWKSYRAQVQRDWLMKVEDTKEGSK